MRPEAEQTLPGHYTRIQAWKQHPLLAKPRQWSFDVRSLLAREPLWWPLFQVYIWWDQYNLRSRGHAAPEERVVGPSTEIVIDGYPGSANSFATAAFRQSQRQPVRMAHHLHAPVQIRRAVLRGIPTIVTIRDPRGAVLSLTSRWPHVTVRQGLRNYIHFYERLQPLADRFVISTFARTTQHFDRVVAEVNARFGTHFDLFEPTEENLRALRRPEKFQTEAWKQRQAWKKRKARDFEKDEVQRLLQRAEAIHAWYEERAGAFDAMDP
ncbi:MAG: hypothetical protein KatS3mg044_0685 [Rhodothermaceae bacterium]|nr:MAG: hypothetical protein KatS3mg044_0685 [Rhodothermaceae bacterium]